MVEQDHRRVKQRLSPLLGFKNFADAGITISGLELAQQIKQGQFETARITTGSGAVVADLWEMVIAASAQGHKADVRP